MTLYCNGQPYVQYDSDTELWMVDHPYDSEWHLFANLLAIADAVWEGQE